MLIANGRPKHSLFLIACCCSITHDFVLLGFETISSRGRLHTVLIFTSCRGPSLSDKCQQVTLAPSTIQLQAGQTSRIRTGMYAYKGRYCVVSASVDTYWYDLLMMSIDPHWKDFDRLSRLFFDQLNVAMTSLQIQEERGQLCQNG